MKPASCVQHLVQAQAAQPSAPRQHSGKARWQHRWRLVHRWVALILGLIIALMGATGALLELRQPILKWEVGERALALKPHHPDSPMLAAESWTLAAQRAYPQFKQILGSAPPRGGFLTSDNALVFGLLQDRSGMGVAMIDPYDGEARAFFVFNDLWLAKIVAFHRSLLLPPTLGRPVLIVCGLALTLSMLSGLYLWWPTRRHSWASMMLKPGHRRLRDWHNASALWLYVPLLIVTLTGLILSFPPNLIGSRSLHSTVSNLHGTLMLGTPGAWISGLTGIALCLLYVTGLSLWWRRRPRRLNRRTTQAGATEAGNTDAQSKLTTRSTHST